MAKVMVSLPDDLLAEIDAAARRRSTTRSGLLAEAARREIRRRDAAVMQEAAARMEAVGAAFAVDRRSAEDLVRADRDDRDARDQLRAGGC